MKTRVAHILLALALAAPAWGSGDGRPAENLARTILTQNGVAGGLIVHLGCGHPEDSGLTAALGATAGCLVHGVDADPGRVERVRADLRAAGIHGAAAVDDLAGGRLPYADAIVRLLVVSDPCGVAPEEMRRVLAPGGRIHALRSGAAGEGFERPWPEGIDGWPQFMYDGSGNPVSKDTQAGPPRSLRWRCGPLHQRSHNWDIGLAAMVADAGRVLAFVDEGPAGVHHPDHPEDWRLIARDAFSGVKLWERPLAEWGSRHWAEPTAFTFTWATPFTLNRRLVLAGDCAYATLRYRTDSISVLDAATGATIREIKFGGTPDEFVYDNGRLYARVRTLPEPYTGTKFPSDPALKGKEKGGKDDIRPKTALDWMKSLPPEKIAAVDAATGRILWETPARFVLVETLAAVGGRVFYRDFDHVIALDAVSGKELWRTPCEARYSGSFGRGHAGGLAVYEGKVFCNSTTGLVGFDAESGKELWRSAGFWPQYAYFAPVSIRGAQGLVWHRQGTGYDPATGAQKRKLDVGDLLTGKSRCYRQVGAGRYFFDSFWGIQSVDMTGDNHSADPWIRGMCSYGFIPAYGMLYVPQEPCNCFMGIKLNGFHALAPAIPAADFDGADLAARRVQGSAYGKVPRGKPGAAKDAAPSDWPVFRADARRSGLAAAPVGPKLAAAWNADLGGSITPPTVAGGRVFVARKDTGEVICLGADDGREIWRFTAGGGVNTPPTLHEGAAYFGAGDGWVYCLDAATGSLAWKFRAAPGHQRIVSMERLESIWPCDGSLLFRDGLLLCAAGRSSYLDGGIFLYALDPKTGEVRQRSRLDGPWPSREALRNPPKNPMADMLGFSRDLFVIDGGETFMNLARLDAALRPEDLPLQNDSGKSTSLGRRLMGRHLMATGGFTDDTLFHRVGLHYADTWPGFNNVHGGPNAGTLFCFDQTHGYSVKHYNHSSRYPDHVPGAGNFLTKDPLDAPSAAEGTRLERVQKPLWERNVPIVARALLAAPGAEGGGAAVLFAAGLPDANDPKDPLAPYLGRGTPKLIVVAAEDGRVLGETALPGAPVFDGMAAAGGAVYVSMAGGKLVRLNSVP